MKAVTHLQRYLLGTTDLGLKYTGGPVQLEAWVDSSWSDDVDNAESQYGWRVDLCGAPVAWKSGLQRCTAQSSTEAEYVALADLICELLFLTSLLAEMGHLQQPVQVREDNKGVLFIAKGEGKHSKRRHINIKYHLAQKYLDELYYLDDVRGQTNDADIFTKPSLTDEQFYTYRDSMLTKLFT
jgi:hypothetical protein